MYEIRCREYAYKSLVEGVKGFMENRGKYPYVALIKRRRYFYVEIERFPVREFEKLIICSDLEKGVFNEVT